MSFHPFIIEHKDEKSSKTTNKVYLMGSSLPEEALTTSRKTVTNRTLYPGSRQATIQVLGIDYQPINIKGLLSDIETGVEGYADSLRAVLEQFQKEQSLLRILYRKTSVLGVIKKLTFHEKDPYEIEYEIEFELSSNGEDKEDKNFSQAYDSYVVRMFLEEFMKKLAKFFKSLNKNTVQQEEDTEDEEPQSVTLVNKMENKVNGVIKAIDDVTKSPVEVDQIAKEARHATSDVKDYLTKTEPSGNLNNQFSATDLVLDCVKEADNLALSLGKVEAQVV